MTRTRVSTPLATLVLTVFSIYLGIMNVDAQGGLKVGFYARSCPGAEGLVREVVSNAVRSNSRTGAGLIRTMFHDCFVQGCDASVLLDGANSEKTARPNLSLHGFDVIDAAKARVETKCPGIVSCADIVVMAARDSFAVLSGTSPLFFPIETGRRDGTVSLASNTGDIPSPLSNADSLIGSFANKGLSRDDMVILSGSHTVGKAQCAAFSNRLTPTVDPTLDPSFAQTLLNNCPNGPSSTLNDLDLVTPTVFDNQYYKNLQANKGLLTSDQTLFNTASTKPLVNLLASTPRTVFLSRFRKSFRSMSRIGVLTGTAGQVRNSCRAVKP